MTDEAADGTGDDRAAVAALLLRMRKLGIADPRVTNALESVPRSMFVPPDARADAYAERALPIECGQTISSPDIVAIMTAALDIQPDDRVLEIGTGSGYQTAVLSRLAKRVFTVDRFRTLIDSALSRFKTLKITNITTMIGDGMLGWPEEAPFDRIIVTAAGAAVPEALRNQLRIGGVMVIPVGPEAEIQKLRRLARTEKGWEETDLADVRFVPLIPGKAARL